MPERALVTGGAGFVGANLVRRLLERGDDVWLALRPGTDRWRLKGIEDDVRIAELDLREDGAAHRLVAEAEPRAVHHLAAHGAYSWQTDAKQIFETNIVGTLGLLEASAATGVERFVHAGSSSEYGYRDHAPSETEPAEPNSPYAAAKAAATVYCSLFGRERELETATLRLYSAYGPWEEEKRLVPTLIRAALGGGLPPLVNPDIARDFVFVDDVCSAFLAAADAAKIEPGRVYNVASGKQTTIREIVEVARTEFGIEAEPEWGSMPDRGWDTEVWVGDPRLIEAELGWSAMTGLSEGLRATATWVDDYCTRPAT